MAQQKFARPLRKTAFFVEGIQINGTWVRKNQFCQQNQGKFVLRFLLVKSLRCILLDGSEAKPPTKKRTENDLAIRSPMEFEAINFQLANFQLPTCPLFFCVSHSTLGVCKLCFLTGCCRSKARVISKR